jgi:alpha-glucoside transport system substrate-binding protein
MPARLLKRSLILPLLVALVAAGCAPGSSNQGTTTATVKLMTVWSGDELATFKSVVAPWEARTGNKVEIESSTGLDALLSTRVNSGDPPDLAAAPGPAVLTRFANQGKVKDLAKVLDTAKLNSEYSKAWIDLGTVQGKLVEVFSWAAIKGLVWYNPKTWKAKGYTVPTSWTELTALQSKMAANGDKPWCMAVEDSAATGWAGSDFHKEIALSAVGPDVYDKWWQGKQTWSSPEIKSTWTTFGQILGPGDSNVYGGANYIVSTAFGNVGIPMFASPPKCMMLNQASFITSFFQKANPSLKAGEDYTFFPLPDVTSQYAGAHVGAADAWSLFTDKPQAKDLLKYLVTAEAQAIWVKKGGKLSPNNKTNPADYPDDLTRSIAKILVDTKILRYDAGDLMPADMKQAYWTAILDFIKDQSKLDAILTRLDGVQKTAYTT